MAEVVQDSGCSDLTGFAPLTDAFLSSHAQENMIETNWNHTIFSSATLRMTKTSLSEATSGKA